MPSHFVAVVAPQILFRFFSHLCLDSLIEQGRCGNGIHFGQVNLVAFAVLQTFAIRHDDGGASLFGQAAGQRHGVGRFAKEVRPFAFAFCGNLVRQYANRLPLLQGVHQTAYALHIGRCERDLAFAAASINQGREPVLLGRAKQHGNRVFGCVVDRGDLEAAQMRRDEDEAFAGGKRVFHQMPVIAIFDVGERFCLRPLPDGERLQDGFACLADVGVDDLLESCRVWTQATLRQILLLNARRGGCAEMYQPAQYYPHFVDDGQRQLCNEL